jgi:hypothetical protein
MQDVAYECGNNDHLPASWHGLNSPLEHRMNWRFRAPDHGHTVTFNDSCKGVQTFTADVDYGDFSVWRLDGYPSYELAVVVDDLLMGVTEVVRGEDLLLSTARQLLLIKAIFGLDYAQSTAWYDCVDGYEDSPAFPSEVTALTDSVSVGTETAVAADADRQVTAGTFTIPTMTTHTSYGHEDPFSVEALLAYRIPCYFHSPLVCDEHGVRLAKRNFAKSLRKLREEGVTPEEIREDFCKNIAAYL